MSTEAVAPPVVAESKQETLFGHPRGLTWLFFTEASERFSYYGMRALLVLYLINYLQFRPSEASTVYKWYTSLVFFTPLIGGFFADRLLGLRKAIIFGACTMAVGHFLMAFEPLWALYTALALLIVGNGFFKPNISTLVGKMYKPGDPRRDGAFSIFYMGINTGALIAPIVVGRLHKYFSFHYGFGAAGIVMVLGLVVFLTGKKRVIADVQAAGNSDAPVSKQAEERAKHLPVQDDSELQPGVGGVAGAFSTVMPFVLFGLALIVPPFFILKAIHGEESWINVIMPSAFAILGGAMGYVLLTIRGAARNKSTVIFVLFIFAVLFWMAFEQAGNALNIWAEFNTVRTLGPISVTAEDFQSINSVFVVSCAPLFALLWTWLERRGKGIPTAGKVLMTMIFATCAFLAMVGAAASENATLTRVKVPEGLPAEVKPIAADSGALKGLTGELYALTVPGEKPTSPPIVLHAGRLLYDRTSQELVVRGTFPPFARMDALKPTVDPGFYDAVGRIEAAAKYAEEKLPKTALLAPLPEGYALPKLVNAEGQSILAGSKPVLVKYTPAADGQPSKVEQVTEGGQPGVELTLIGSLNPLAKASLVGSGSTAQWRGPIDSLAEQADRARVSGWWLILVYLFSSLGELCISPVGLSLVTKLAPVRYAALFMGVFFLTNSVAQYVGGSLGELWGTVAPTSYFLMFVITSAVGAVVLIPLIPVVKKLMHEVR